MHADHYDGFAALYDAENQRNLLNAYYDRPAMIRLAGDVAGRRILDAGCGSGPLTAALRAAGAQMTGVDGSPAMLALARERLGDDVPLHVADLAEPLPFADGAFDDVVASLVLHYLEDWDAVLRELHRVLRPGGRVILSVNHPAVRVFFNPDENYFATRQYVDTFVFDDDSVQLPFWHRSLTTMVREFLGAGFRISALEEPPPAPDAPRDLLPPRVASGEREAFLCFLYVVLTAE